MTLPRVSFGLQFFGQAPDAHSADAGGELPSSADGAADDAASTADALADAAAAAAASEAPASASRRGGRVLSTLAAMPPYPPVPLTLRPQPPPATPHAPPAPLTPTYTVAVNHTQLQHAIGALLRVAIGHAVDPAAIDVSSSPPVAAGDATASEGEHAASTGAPTDGSSLDRAANHSIDVSIEARPPLDAADVLAAVSPPSFLAQLAVSLGVGSASFTAGAQPRIVVEIVAAPYPPSRPPGATTPVMASPPPSTPSSAHEPPAPSTPHALTPIAAPPLSPLSPDALSGLASGGGSDLSSSSASGSLAMWAVAAASAVGGLLLFGALSVLWRRARCVRRLTLVKVDRPSSRRGTSRTSSSPPLLASPSAGCARAASKRPAPTAAAAIIDALSADVTADDCEVDEEVGRTLASVMAMEASALHPTPPQASPSTDSPPALPVSLPPRADADGTAAALMGGVGAGCVARPMPRAARRVPQPLEDDSKDDVKRLSSLLDMLSDRMSDGSANEGNTSKSVREQAAEVAQAARSRLSTGSIGEGSTSSKSVREQAAAVTKAARSRAAASSTSQPPLPARSPSSLSPIARRATARMATANDEVRPPRLARLPFGRQRSVPPPSSPTAGLDGALDPLTASVFHHSITGNLTTSRQLSRLHSSEILGHGFGAGGSSSSNCACSEHASRGSSEDDEGTAAEGAADGTATEATAVEGASQAWTLETEAGELCWSSPNTRRLALARSSPSATKVLQRLRGPSVDRLMCLRSGAESTSAPRPEEQQAMRHVRARLARIRSEREQRKAAGMPSPRCDATYSAQRGWVQRATVYGVDHYSTAGSPAQLCCRPAATPEKRGGASDWLAREMGKDETDDAASNADEAAYRTPERQMRAMPELGSGTSTGQAAGRPAAGTASSIRGSLGMS